MPPASSAILRIPCPHCQRVLKIPLQWAGRRGTCPACGEKVAFPASLATQIAKSKLGEQLLGMINESDDPLDEKSADQLALVLSQGTCNDYQLARGLLGERRLSAKQWRSVLVAAGAREAMRQHVELQAQQIDALPEDDLPVLATLETPAGPESWRIMARFAYFLRHQTCDGCKEDPTGLHCMYLSYEAFAKARSITPERSDRWEKVCQHLLGL